MKRSIATTTVLGVPEERTRESVFPISALAAHVFANNVLHLLSFIRSLLKKFARVPSLERFDAPTIRVDQRNQSI
jgi:hypothetical protein